MMTDALTAITYTNYHYLVFGYIRELESTLSKQIAPDEICSLCYKYYYSTSKLILLKQPSSSPYDWQCVGDGGGFIVDIDKPNSDKTIFEFKMTNTPHMNGITLHESFVPKIPCHQWNILDLGVCAYSNMSLPNKVLSQAKLKRYNNNVIFKAGYYGVNHQDNECGASIFNNNAKEITAPFYWRLPPFTKTVTSNTLIYSKKYGLISIGGEKSKDIMSLSFNNLDDMIDFTDWKWKHVTKMDNDRKNTACCMIQETKLFMYGGTLSAKYVTGYEGSASKNTAIYDFEEDEWIQLKNAKYGLTDINIYYDREKQRIFSIGGTDNYYAATKQGEYYDIHKNNWFRIPNTIKKHGYYPVIWKEGDMLFCASNITGIIESYDLREVVNIKNYNSGWRIYAHLDKYFGNNSSPSFSKSKILRFIDDYL